MSGLLEQAVLLLDPPRPDGLRLLRALSGQPVGFARPRRRPWWCRWLPPILAVHEQDDEPLLCTVRRRLALLPWREVLDADDEMVGTIALPWLMDRWSRPAVEVRLGPPGKGVFLSLSGEELAEWTTPRGAMRLDIRESARNDPFLKMLLLAALLHAPATAGEG
jgi:hypothetical protein